MSREKAQNEARQLTAHFEFLHDNPPAPFNPLFRPGLQEAVEREYGEYCDRPTTDQSEGPSEERAAEYSAIRERLIPQFPVVGDTGN